MIRAVHGWLLFAGLGILVLAGCEKQMQVKPDMVEAKNLCTKADHDYADFFDNYYVPEAAYKFGLKIQRFVKEKDMQALYALTHGSLRIEGKLYEGDALRQIFAADFDDFLARFGGGQEWSRAVLAAAPPCAPTGSRGFMIAGGRVWYDFGAGQWGLNALNIDY